ncbi:hypothetical protein EFA69_02630 [Rufibacter immobilis]|uniref:Uncharacterized protein n=1 Tax=Rufibacter immobilis TaxID=1348778 RepID=A0A3M9N363_9BACT|nr:hypothetical protein [Rufibacter immobilis]RNI32241.1 hypothetical protein EFA69_02630 [Rufibacter immobilis]
MRKTKWVIYTVGVGILPLFARALLSAISDKPWCAMFVFNESDLVTYSLALCLANIIELDGIEERQLKKIPNLKPNFKTKNRGASLLMIMVVIIVYSAVINAELDNGAGYEKVNTKVLTGILALVNTLISYSIFDRIKNI